MVQVIVYSVKCEPVPASQRAAHADDGSFASLCSIGAVSYSAWTVLLYKYQHVLPRRASGAEQVGARRFAVVREYRSRGRGGESALTVLHVAGGTSLRTK